MGKRIWTVTFLVFVLLQNIGEGVALFLGFNFLFSTLGLGILLDRSLIYIETGIPSALGGFG